MPAQFFSKKIKVFLGIAALGILLLITNFMSAIIAIFQYGLKPWSLNVPLTSFQFSHYVLSRIKGEILAINQANAFKIHGYSLLIATIITISILAIILLIVYVNKRYDWERQKELKKLIEEHQKHMAIEQAQTEKIEVKKRTIRLAQQMQLEFLGKLKYEETLAISELDATEFELLKQFGITK